MCVKVGVTCFEKKVFESLEGDAFFRLVFVLFFVGFLFFGCVWVAGEHTRDAGCMFGTSPSWSSSASSWRTIAWTSGHRTT